MPASAALALSLRWRSSGTLRIWTITAMRRAYLHGAVHVNAEEDIAKSLLFLFFRSGKRYANNWGVASADRPQPFELTYVIAYSIGAELSYEAGPMTTLTASEARANLYRLIDEAAATHTPATPITGKCSNAVLIAEEDWHAMQETLYLLSIPGMRETLREGSTTPIEECRKALDW